MCKVLAVDLFSGAGGMSLGAHRAGIDVVVSTDIDRYACATYGRNFPETKVHCCDIKDFSLTRTDVGCSSSPVVVFGGPPCQGFSTSNQKTRTESNVNNWLFEEFLRVCTGVYPEWIVFENVKGIFETANGSFVNAILEELEGLGYVAKVALLNAKNYGVPQSRTRFFIVANRLGVDFRFPEIITENCVTVWEAIGDLPKLHIGNLQSEKRYRSKAVSGFSIKMRGDKTSCLNNLVSKNSDIVVERYKHIPQGGNWENIPRGLLTNYKDVSRCHTGIYKRLEAAKPSVVIGNFRKNMLIHPFEDRGLSVREAARLQSFPDDFEFIGSIGFQQQQVGNAVPPMLAQAVFEKIISYDL